MNFKKMLTAGILSLALIGFVGCGEVEDIDPDALPVETPALDETPAEETPAEEESPAEEETPEDQETPEDDEEAPEEDEDIDD